MSQSVFHGRVVPGVEGWRVGCVWMELSFGECFELHGSGTQMETAWKRLE